MKKPLIAMDSARALQLLKIGYQRYLVRLSHLPVYEPEWRESLAQQLPFAVIVCCSDLRVPPEAVFDKRPGDLFVVRTAGHVVDDAGLGSIEYAVEHLKVPLIVVLGHENCTVVAAALNGGHAQGHVPSVIERILPAVEQSRGQPGDPLTNAIQANVRQVVAALQASEPILAPQVRAGALQVLGACFNPANTRLAFL